MIALPDAAAWTEIEQLTFEKEALGLYWSGHPIDRYAADLKEFGAKTIADLLGHGAEPVAEPDAMPIPTRPCRSSAAATTSASAASSPRSGRSRRGRATAMAVFMLEDRTAASRSWCSRRPSQRAAALIENGTLVVVSGKLERDDEAARMLASDILPIGGVRERLARELAITSDDAAAQPRDVRGAGGPLRADTVATSRSRCSWS